MKGSLPQPQIPEAWELTRDSQLCAWWASCSCYAGSEASCFYFSVTTNTCSLNLTG